MTISTVCSPNEVTAFIATVIELQVNKNYMGIWIFLTFIICFCINFAAQLSLFMSSKDNCKCQNIIFSLGDNCWQSYMSKIDCVQPSFKHFMSKYGLTTDLSDEHRILGAQKSNHARDNSHWRSRQIFIINQPTTYLYFSATWSFLERLCFCVSYKTMARENFNLAIWDAQKKTSFLEQKLPLRFDF